MELLQESPQGLQVPPVNPKEDIAVLLYTGGTTGVSKGVMLSHYNLTANVTQIREWLQMGDEHHTVLAVLPMFHSYGFTAAVGMGLASGSTLILVPRFDAGDLLKTIAKYRPTMFPGVPTMYIGLLNHPDLNKYDLSSPEALRHRCGGHAGGPAAPLRAGDRRHHHGGVRPDRDLTGDPCQPARRQADSGQRRPCPTPAPTCGSWIWRPARTCRRAARARSSSGARRSCWATGTGRRRPPRTMRDGWLYTGDIGRMDDDGYLYIVDRKKDMIIAGGFNIYPREIDEVLYQHPAVLEACAVGVPDAYRGETVKAFVVLKPGAQATEQEILDVLPGAAGGLQAAALGGVPA